MNPASKGKAPANDRPILSEAKRKSLIALVGSAVAAAVSFGVISPELAEQISSGWAWALGAIVTVIPFVTSVLHSLGIVKGAEPKTTPVDSPTGNDGEPLVSVADAQLWRPDVEGVVAAATDSAGGEPDELPEAMADELPDDIVDDDSIGSLELGTLGRHSQRSVEDTTDIEPVG